MKKLLLGFCLLITLQTLTAQPYGNEWIDYSGSKYYLKFKVAEDGIYRIDKSALEFALNNLSPPQSIANIDPRSIQVFAKGSEQFVHIEGEADGTFDNGDYIELFCEKNDGWLDERLYPSADQHTNPLYSLYSDTLTYFLTWNSDGSASQKRYTTVPYTGPAVSVVPYLLMELEAPFTNTYQNGEDIGQGKANTLYHGGKGWASGQFGYNNNGNGGGVSKNFATPNAYTGGNAPNLDIELGIFGINRGAEEGPAHHVRLRYNSGTGFAEFDDVFLESYEFTQHNAALPPGLASSGSISLQCYTSPAGAANQTTSDYSAASYISLTYPRTTNFSGENPSRLAFKVPASANTVHANFTSWASGPVDAVYDLTQGIRYETAQSGNNLRFNIAAGIERDLFISTNPSVVDITANLIKPAGNGGLFTNPMSFEKDSAFLIISNKRLETSANTYRAYRNTTHTGQVSLIFIDELIDQFAYGIPLHPLSIRNFTQLAFDTWNSPPQHLLLLGKSVVESEHRKSSATQKQVMVPTMGNPPSDYYFTAGFESNPHAPTIATGRLSAQNNQQVNAYREKLRQAELAQKGIASEYTIGKKQWQKHILHFAGGDNEGENRVFVSNLNGYTNTIDNSTFGGKTFLFSKTSGSVIEQLDLDTVRDLIRDGVSVMTFFGHGTQSGFDVNVDNPATWDNNGRYPLVLANSCFSGNIHLPTNGQGGISEQYVLLANLGAIGFVATPGLSFPSDLDNYTGNLYREFAEESYGKSIGQQMLETAIRSSPSTANDEFDKRKISMGLEMTLHGDPAYSVNPHSRAEYTVNDPVLGPDFRFEPAIVTTDVDSFDVVLNISNLGKKSTQPVNIVATRSFPTGAADHVLYKTVDGFGYEEEVRFRFAVDGENGIGENQLTFEVDLPADSIPEFDDLNNNTIASFSFDVIDGDISPVYPYNFGVVADMNVTLRANTGYPFAPSLEYVIQLDTTDTYNSPFYQTLGEETITQSGAVLEWNPGLQNFGFADSTVFFWRVAPNNDRSKWREFSFQVIRDQFGWGQAHFFQYKNNSFDFIEYDRNIRKFKFEEASRNLSVTVLPNPDLSSLQETSATEYRLDGQLAPLGEYGMAPLGPPSLAIAVVDTLDLTPWGTRGVENGFVINNDRQFGNNNDYSAPFARKRVEYFFSFRITDTNSMNNMIDMINNHVPDGYYILAYTLNNGQFQNSAFWKEEHYTTFEALGADSIRHVGNRHPYILLSKKGAPNEAQEAIGTDETSTLRLNSKLFSTVKQGSVQSRNVGPAMKWGSFHTNPSDQESTGGDQTQSIAIGTNISGNEKNVSIIAGSGSESLANVNADSTLDMKMRLETADNSNGTPAQLRSWHLLSDPAPDVAVNPILGVALRSRKINAGEKFHWGVALQNISEFDFENLKVVYWVTEKGGKIVQSDTLVYTGMVAGKVLFDSVEISTIGLSGKYTLWLQANPLGPDWHKEQYAFNNRAYQSITVKADNNNPLLDVTFDGIHILNGDIVSPTPEIVMELKDENPYLLMTDTSTFDVFIQSPNGQQARIPFQRNGREIMVFEPATSKKNKARLTYRPESLSDGEYSLTVIGRDASGNRSGQDAYKIDFEVINRSTVTQVMNYPNPFTTSTQFVFTLTGSKIPDVFTVQILSVTGKVVKEVTKNELGNIHIGRNITDYTWNGTDHFGDRLANGVYLYRVIMKIDGETIERRESGADEYFTKEFGKMYLFR